MTRIWLTKVLEIAASHIRVIATPNGGGFGGKSDPFNHEVIVCKLSMITGRPVKCTLTREEVFYCHRGRHPVLMNVKTGVPDLPARALCGGFHLLAERGRQRGRRGLLDQL